jgi:hypothetical protein
MTVAWRFIAGSGTTMGPASRRDTLNTAARSIPQVSFFKADTISIERSKAARVVAYRSVTFALRKQLERYYGFISRIQSNTLLSGNAGRPEIKKRTMQRHSKKRCMHSLQKTCAGNS